MKKYLLLILIAGCCSAPVKKDDVSHNISEAAKSKIENVKTDVNKFVTDESAKSFINRDLENLQQNIDDLTVQNDSLNSAKEEVIKLNNKLTAQVDKLKLEARNNLAIGAIGILILRFILWFIFKFVLPSAVSAITDKIKETIKAWFKKNVIDRIWKK